MRAIILSVSLLFLALGAFAQNLAKGFVFHDANENRMKEATERGIPEVAFSNGVDIVITDENLPQFYYLHKPKGHPENYTYSGVGPTGDLPEEVRPLGTPMPSTHLWKANIGSDFPAGRHTIQVRAKDRYGPVFTSFKTFRVVE
ncbi:MAG TPA: hypothetical protein VJ953_22415 [Saprospiraceae bacterium]|nr:hypothetical protein [Saprospiraceae bacterium]